jgi:hypothetical protein
MPSPALKYTTSTRLNYNTVEGAKMTEAEKPAVELAQVESAAPSEGMRYVFIDKEQEKRVVRKQDFHILPIFMALCKFSLEVDTERRRGD